MTAFEIWRNASNGRVVIRKTDDDGCITGAEKIYPNGLLVITEEQREAIEGRAVSPSLNMFTNGTLTLVSTGGSGGGASVHNDLSGRTAADAHPQAAVTGLVADLAGKVPTTRTVAGLDLTADRSAADVRGALGTGTPDGTTYLRGDGQWAAAGGGGGLTLGETNSTAYRGDRGKTAYDHSQSTGNPHSTAIGDISGLQTALDGKAPATRTVGTGLGTTGTVNLDLASLHGTIQTMTLTGNPTFTTSNLAAGREVTLVIAAGGAGRTIAYPAWVAVGAALPTSLASGKTLVVTLLATSTTDASVVAAAAVQP